MDYEREQSRKHSKNNLGETIFERRRFALDRLQQKIKRNIEAMAQQRLRLRTSKSRTMLPTVAVVGYTNCGKTSLVKALTGASDDNERLQPKDQLFATLDVTCHLGRLPLSNLKCIYIDTVGFISDIPTQLIASFSATLEDAAQADVIVHVRDMAHPAADYQNTQVMDTLAKMNFSFGAAGDGVVDAGASRVITAGNKIDLLMNDVDTIRRMRATGILPISARERLGLSRLAREVEQRLIESTKREQIVYRIRPGGEEERWLRQNGNVIDCDEAADDPNFVHLKVLVSVEAKAKFVAKFVSIK